MRRNDHFVGLHKPNLEVLSSLVLEDGFEQPIYPDVFEEYELIFD